MRKKLIAFFSFLMLIMSLSGCLDKSLNKEYTFFALDTVVTYKGSNPQEAENLIRSYEKLLSVTDSNSDISRINSNKSANVSDETSCAISKALEISDMTDGAFDITLLPVSKAWGFFSHEYTVPSEAEIDTLLACTGYKQVKVSGSEISIPEGFMIDLGGIAKGFITDRLVEFFTENNIENALFSLGGNVYARGTKNGKKWVVAIKDPFEDGTLGSVSVTNKAVITSGGYERNFTVDGKKYHHILDPKTGFSASSGLASVTVVSENATLADGLSTALFVMGYDRAVELWKNRTDFEMILVDNSSSIYVTEGLSDCCDFTHKEINR